MASKPAATRDDAVAKATGKTWLGRRSVLSERNRVTVCFGEKTGGRSIVHVNHEKLTDGEATATRRARWRGG